MPEETNKSVICLSMHKAGSTIADKILLDFFNAKGMEIDRISLGVPSSPLTERDVFITYQDKMQPTGVYYGIARGAYVSEMPVIKDLKVIVQVRDPRDCITSAYFSFKTSHRPPKDPEKRKAFMKRRRKLENLDIDEYALAQVKGYQNRMRILRDIIEAHDDILVLKYEDMVEHTEDWLGRISEFTQQPLTEDLRTDLGEKIDFSVDAEDISRHKRQVSPGDHTRKLKPETIAEMSEQMQDELAFFGYAA